MIIRITTLDGQEQQFRVAKVEIDHQHTTDLRIVPGMFGHLVLVDVDEKVIS